VLRPLVVEAARRTGAGAVGLVDLGCAAGLALSVDRVGITYDGGAVVGDPASPVQLACSVVWDRPFPTAALPGVVARVGVDPDPLDVTDPADVRWLRACLPPDRPEPAARLDADVALAAADPPLLLRGDPVELLPEAVARVPAGALPVVLTTWVLSRIRPEGRPRLLQRLEDAAAGRPVAWVSAEGVGVAPAVPTLGDRRASGHSTLGVAAVHRTGLHVEAVGRCWSRGRSMSWLVDP
jgi:hypothetical protein